MESEHVDDQWGNGGPADHSTYMPASEAEKGEAEARIERGDEFVLYTSPEIKNDQGEYMVILIFTQEPFDAYQTEMTAPDYESVAMVATTSNLALGWSQPQVIQAVMRSMADSMGSGN